MRQNMLSDPMDAFPEHAPKRVVSLVPSITGSLIDLGMSAALVGISDYCEVSDSLANQVDRIGGPKRVDTKKVIALAPDLVLANQEENAREDIEALATVGLPIWLTFPVSVQQAIDDLWATARLFRSEAAMQQVDMLERAMEWARHASESSSPVRYFCPIWQDELPDGTPWWMTFNCRTYSDDLLAGFRGENVFARRERRYPLAADLSGRGEEPAGERDTRYPRLTVEEIAAAQPEVILLPSEPYTFTEGDARKMMETFADSPAVRSERVFLVDGSLITWPGTRMARALEELGEIFSTE